jgi:NAD(P)-dependent dehydrogenase (short-subunit alcohol dehydrogenase family)
MVLRDSSDIILPSSIRVTFSPMLSQAYDDIMGANLRGVILCLKHQIPFMLATSDAPAIVITSSLAGHQGVPGMSLYSTSKWAVRGLAACAAREYGPLGLR